MENLFLKGALLSEMLENALLKICFEENKKPVDLENETDRIIERAITNTEILLCDGEKIELQRQVFTMIQMFMCSKSTSNVKKEIQAIYVKYHATQTEVEKIMSKAKEGLEKTNDILEKGKEIYNEAKPTISIVMATINLLKIFFKK